MFLAPEKPSSRAPVPIPHDHHRCISPLVKRIIRARAKTHCRDEVPPAFSSFCLFKDASRAD